MRKTRKKNSINIKKHFEKSTWDNKSREFSEGYSANIEQLPSKTYIKNAIGRKEPASV
jgi:hypothetical protein